MTIFSIWRWNLFLWEQKHHEYKISKKITKCLYILDVHFDVPDVEFFNNVKIGDIFSNVLQNTTG